MRTLSHLLSMVWWRSYRLARTSKVYFYTLSLTPNGSDRQSRLDDAKLQTPNLCLSRHQHYLPTSLFPFSFFQMKEGNFNRPSQASVSEFPCEHRGAQRMDDTSCQRSPPEQYGSLVQEGYTMCATRGTLEKSLGSSFYGYIMYSSLTR
ncbi:hypothetical protein F4802DRAFT_169000 [Xylaria palmicola]|nr:hypothetical protein F4802DRAFT_169000 [Xylaria palmicola]